MIIIFLISATCILAIAFLSIHLMLNNREKIKKKYIDFHTFANILQKLEVQFYIKSLISRKEYFYIIHSNKQIFDFKKYLIKFDNYKQIHSTINLARKFTEKSQKIEMKMMGENISYCSVIAIKSETKTEAIIAIFTKNIEKKIINENTFTKDIENAILSSTFGIAIKDKHLNKYFSNESYSEIYNQNYTEMTKIETQYINNVISPRISHTFTIFQKNIKKVFCVKIHNFTQDKFFILVDSVEEETHSIKNTYPTYINELKILNKVSSPCALIKRNGIISTTNNHFNIMFKNIENAKKTKNFFQVIYQSQIGLTDKDISIIKNKLAKLENSFKEEQVFHFITQDMTNIDIEISQYNEETLLCIIIFSKSQKDVQRTDSPY